MYVKLCWEFKLGCKLQIKYITVTLCHRLVPLINDDRKEIEIESEVCSAINGRRVMSYLNENLKMDFPWYCHL